MTSRMPRILFATETGFSFMAISHTSNQRLAIEIGELSKSLEINDYVTSAMTMSLKNKHTLCWSVPLPTTFETRYFSISKCSTR